MIKNILLLAGIISIGCLGFFFLSYQGDISVARTGVFLLLILLEFIVIQIIRKDYGVKFRSNRWLFFAIAGSIIMTLSLIYIPALATIFKLTPLPAEARREIGGIIAITSIGAFFYNKRSFSKHQ
jgi:magnesium-transporting ATPase (P-type)